MTKLKLYHYPASPLSRAVLLTIKYLGLDVEVIIVNLLEKEQYQPWFLELNPQHTVPVLDDDGFIMNESRAITPYLVNKYAPGNDLYPTDPKARAIVDQRMYFDATTLLPRGRQISAGVLFMGQTVITDDQKKNLFDAIGWLNDFLKETKYVAGNKLTIADIAIVSTLANAIHMGLPLTNYPNVQRWWNDCKSLPGFAENDEGAKMFGDKIKAKLTQGF